MEKTWSKYWSTAKEKKRDSEQSSPSFCGTNSRIPSLTYQFKFSGSMKSTSNEILKDISSNLTFPLITSGYHPSSSPLGKGQHHPTMCGTTYRTLWIQEVTSHELRFRLQMYDCLFPLSYNCAMYRPDEK